MTHQIELRRVKGDSGGRTIFVDSIPWGTAHMESHGPNGNSFNFKQAVTGRDIGSGQFIYRTYKGTGKFGRDRVHPVRVVGDKIASRALPHGQSAAPVDDRLMDEIKTMIAEGLLRHPDVVKKENDRAHERRIAQEEAAEQKARKKWNDKARSVLSKLDGYITTGPNEDDVKLIVEAMKWAQTQ